MGTFTTWLNLFKPDVSDNVDVSADLNSNFDIISSMFVGTFSVVTYGGATGNGVTDDSSAIQSTLDHAASVASTLGGSCIVIIPPGKYLIGQSTRLIIQSNVIVWAYGAYIFKGGSPTNGIIANFNSSTSSFGGYSGYSNIAIMGGVWDAKAQNAATNAAFDTVDFNHCRNILCKDMVFRNGCSDHALEFNSTDGGVALNCRFEGFRDATSGLTRQFSEAIQIDVAVSGSATIPLFDGTHSKNIFVIGCTSGPATDGSGLGSYGKLVGSHTTASGGFYSGIVILGNTINGSLDIAIGGYNWCDSQIIGNTILNAGSHGIRVTVPDPTVVGFSALCRDVVVSNNNINTTVGTGIEILGYTTSATIQNCSVSNNVITSAGTIGVFAQLTNGISITDNICDSPASNAINTSGIQYPFINGNTIRNPGSNYGIFLGQVTSPSTVNTTDGQISNNLILLGANATAGMRLSTGVTLCYITGNTVRKNGGSSAIAVSAGAGAGTTNWVDGNDFSGFGDNAATITISSGTVNKSIASGTNIGRNIG